MSKFTELYEDPPYHTSGPDVTDQGGNLGDLIRTASRRSVDTKWSVFFNDLALRLDEIYQEEKRKEVTPVETG